MAKIKLLGLKRARNHTTKKKDGQTYEFEGRGNKTDYIYSITLEASNSRKPPRSIVKHKRNAIYAPDIILRKLSINTIFTSRTFFRGSDLRQFLAQIYFTNTADSDPQ